MLQTIIKSPALCPVVIDAPAAVRRMGLPAWVCAALRRMPIGVALPIVDFRGPGITDFLHGHTAVIVTREAPNTYLVEALWTLHVGRNANRRGVIWSSNRLKLLPGRRVELLQAALPSAKDTRLQELRDLTIVLRRCQALSRWARTAGDDEAFVAFRPEFYEARAEAYNSSPCVEFLERMRVRRKHLCAA